MTKINQKPKHVEVLVASTLPIIWKEVVNKDNVATQKRNSADADYIAFFRIQLEDKNGKLYSAITHTAKIRNSNNNASLKDFLKNIRLCLNFLKKKERGGKSTNIIKNIILRR